MIAIYKREIGAFFASGNAYVFLTIFTLLSGVFFNFGVLVYCTADIGSMFSSMFIVILFLVPILTMKLMSEEKKNHTDQALLTAPVSLCGIVLGKFFAALTLFMIAESIAFSYAIIINYFGDFIWSTFFCNYFAMLFLGAAFIAVGIFISSLTENQMSSAIASMVVLLMLYLFDSLETNISNEIIRKIMRSLSFYSRYIEFTHGVFNIPNIVFFVSVAFLFNFFTVRVLEKRRWS